MFPNWYRDRSPLRGREESATPVGSRSRSASPAIVPERTRVLPYPSGVGRQQVKTDMTREYRRCAPCISADPPRYCERQRPCIDCIVSGQECQDWGYDEHGQLRLMSRDQALLPLGINIGAVTPPYQNQNTNGGPQIQYRIPQQVTTGNEYRASGYPIPSARQEVRDDPSIDLAQYQQDFRPFTDVRRASRDHNLPHATSASHVLQGQSQNWLTREPEAPEDPFADVRSPGDLYGDDQSGGFGEGNDQDKDMTMFDNDFFDIGNNPNVNPDMPLPEDHSPEQDYAMDFEQDYDMDVDPEEQRRQQQEQQLAQAQPIPSLSYDEVISGPVLPRVPERDSRGVDMMGYPTGCMEIADSAFYYESQKIPDERAGMCNKIPTRRCEHFDNTDFYTCADCHRDQDNLWSSDHRNVVEVTKRHFASSADGTLERA